METSSTSRIINRGIALTKLGTCTIESCCLSIRKSYAIKLITVWRSHNETSTTTAAVKVLSPQRGEARTKGPISHHVSCVKASATVAKGKKNMGSRQRRIVARARPRLSQYIIYFRFWFSALNTDCCERGQTMAGLYVCLLLMPTLRARVPVVRTPPEIGGS